MTRPLPRPWIFAGFVALLAGCSFDQAVADGAMIVCQDDRACPSGWRCSSHGRCGRDDGHAPVATDLRASYLPAHGALVSAPTALSQVSIASLTFATSEPVFPPVVTPRGACAGVVACEQRSGEATRFTFECVSQGAPPLEESCEVAVALEDLSGALGESRFGGALAVDTLPPDPAPVQSAGALVHRRAPWRDDGAPAFARLDLAAPAEDEALLAYDSAEAAAPIAQGNFGGAALELPDPTLAAVFAAKLDRAGNLSARRRVLDEELTVRFGTDPSGASSPHRLEPRKVHSPLLLQPDVSNCATSSKWCIGNGVPGAAVWRRREFAGPRSCGAAVAWDERRARAVSYGGLICNQDPFYSSDRLHEFTGESWLLVSPDRSVTSDAPGQLYGATLSYHAALDVMVMVGGVASTDAFVPDTWIWDSRAWIRVPQAPPPRVHHAAAYDRRSKRVLVFGGMAPDGGVRSDTWAWDLRGWMELDAGTLPGPREGAVMAWDDERLQVVLHGGRRRTDGGALAGGFLFDGERWVPDERFEGVPPLAFHAMASDPVRRQLQLLVPFQADGGHPVEGCAESFAEPKGRSELWGHADGGWRRVGELDLCRRAPLMFFDHRRSEMLVGAGYLGRSSSSDGGLAEFFETLTIWNWNNRFQALDADGGRRAVSEYPDFSTPYARTNHAMAYDPDFGEVMVSGGESGPIRYDEEYFWNGSRWLGGAVGNRPGGRSLHAVAYDRQNKVYVMFGGMGEAGTLVEPGYQDIPNYRVDAGTWLYDRRTPALGWGRRNIPSLPPRLSHALTWNPVSRRVVLSGGSAVLTGDRNDLYAQLNGSLVTPQTVFELGPTGWVQIGRLPGNRRAPGAGAAFDTSRGVLMTLANNLRSNFLTSSVPGGIAECEGTCRDGGFTTFDAFMPPPRRLQSLAYDDARQKILMLGASATELDSMVQDRVWEWDPVDARWGEVVVTRAEGEGTLSPRAGARMAFDERRSRAVVFGGPSAELYELEAAHRRPALVYLVSLKAAQVDDQRSELLGIEVAGAAGGSGERPVDGGFEPVDGARVEAWIAGAWRGAGATSASASSWAPFTAELPEHEWTRVRAPGDRVAVAITPLGANGRTPAMVGARGVYVVLKLRHRP